MASTIRGGQGDESSVASSHPMSDATTTESPAMTARGHPARRIGGAAAQSRSACGWMPAAGRPSPATAIASRRSSAGHELPNRILAEADLVRRRRTKQPRRERLLAGPRPRGRQQLEQTAAPEQIDIVGVEMIRRPEPLARLAVAHPVVPEPSQAALVERHR